MIRIDDTYFITADSHNYILQEKKINQNEEGKNEERLTNIGYYTTIDNALKGLLKKEIRKYVAKDTIQTLKDAVKEFEKIEGRITESAGKF